MEMSLPEMLTEAIGVSSIELMASDAFPEVGPLDGPQLNRRTTSAQHTFDKSFIMVEFEGFVII